MTVLATRPRVSLPPPQLLDFEYDDEDLFQQQVTTFLAKLEHAGLIARWFPVPSGGHRNKAVARIMKARGLSRAGSADIAVLLLTGITAYCELKSIKGTLSDDQKEFRNVCQRVGAPWCVAKTLRQVIDFLAGAGVAL